MKYVLVFLIVFACPANGLPQTSAPPAEPTLRTLLPDLAGDLRRLPSNPAGVSMAIGGIAAAAVSPLDDNLATWNPNDAYKSGQWIGNPFVLAAGTLTAYAVGHWGGKPRVRHLAADALRAQLLSLGLAYSLKYTVQRERPDQSGHDSFPSGHASQTFATATVLARHLGVKAAIPAYATAGFVSLSRINQHRHWLSDVAFGSGLGVAVGWNGSQHASKWTFEPTVSRGAVALQVSYLAGASAR